MKNIEKHIDELIDVAFLMKCWEQTLFHDKPECRKCTFKKVCCLDLPESVKKEKIKEFLMKEVEDD